MLSVLGFIAILGPLVLFHELGHFLFAKLFNIRADIFSVGFGPKLFGKKIGETEFRLSAIPMGGYVKLLGEDGEKELTPEEQKRALSKQVPYKRFLVFLGGPLFNFILAILIYMAILVIGEPQLSSYVGRVVKGSMAEKVGLMSGDHIVAIDGKPIQKFEEMMLAISERPGMPMEVSVERGSSKELLKISITPTSHEGYSVYGESTFVGELDGLLPTARANVLAISDPKSLGAHLGLKNGDKIVEFEGKSVLSWEEIDRAYAAVPTGGKFSLKFERVTAADAKARFIESQFTKPAGNVSMGALTGIYSSELFIEKVVPKSPAENAGLKTGDRIVSIAGKPIESFFELKDGVQRSGETHGKVEINWERDGKLLSTAIVPSATETRDPLLKKTTQYTIGVMPMLIWAEPITQVERVLNPFKLVYKGTERMVSMSYRNLVSIGKMFSGDVSVATLGGPILIGKIAGESISHGLIAFLSTMALLSIGLGVLNMLPIPVLDGGHLVLLGIEMIRGKPLTLRQMEILQQVGLSFILLLMAVVIKNDLTRLPFFN